MLDFFFRPKKPIPKQPKQSNEIEENPEYSYGRRGRLVYKNYEFVKSLLMGSENVIYYRCARHRDNHCKAGIKTIGKKLQVMHPNHNHEPDKNVIAVQPAVWDGSL